MIILVLLFTMDRFQQRKQQLRSEQNDEDEIINEIVDDDICEETTIQEIQQSNNTKVDDISGDVYLPETQYFDTSEHSIFYLDSYIKQRLTKRIRCISVLYADLEKCKSSSVKLVNLKRKINDIESGYEYMYYISLCYDIINKYRICYTDYQNFSFIVHDTSQKKQAHQLECTMNDLLNYYVSVARVYIPIKHTSKITQDIICDACKCTMKCANDQDGYYVCSKCYSEKQININREPVFKDIDRININNKKHAYSRIGHIKDAIQCYQGLQTISPEKMDFIINMLKKECKYGKLSLNPAHKNCISKDDVYMFMEQYKLSDDYKNIYLVYRILTGTPCQDLSDILTVLYEDFETQEKAYESLDHGNRSSSLNVYYKLFKLLQHNNWPCTSKDFYFLKTPDALAEHDEETRIVWDKINWPWIETV